MYDCPIIIVQSSIYVSILYVQVQGNSTRLSNK